MEKWDLMSYVQQQEGNGVQAEASNTQWPVQCTLSAAASLKYTRRHETQQQKFAWV